MSIDTDISTAVHFRSGRGALFALFRAASCSGYRRVYIPEYLCDVVEHAAACSSLDIHFYPLDTAFNPDGDWLLQASTQIAPTDIIVVVNYFGFRQAIDELVSVAQRHGALVVEDNCHGHLSFMSFSQGPIGRTGDVCIGSLRKGIPVPDGAYLIPRSTRITALNLTSPPPCGYLRYLRALCVSRWHTEFRREPTIQEQQQSIFGHEITQADVGVMGGSPSRVSRIGFSAPVCAWIARRRLRQFKKLQAVIADRVTVLWAAQVGKVAIPWACPFITSEASQCHAVLLELRGRGISAHYWPTLPLVLAKSKNSEALRRLHARFGLILLGNW